MGGWRGAQNQPAYTFINIFRVVFSLVLTYAAIQWELELLYNVMVGTLGTSVGWLIAPETFFSKSKHPRVSGYVFSVSLCSLNTRTKQGLFATVVSIIFYVTVVLLVHGLVMRNEALIEEVRPAGEAKMEFLASMSHEIRTPLNAILGESELNAKQNKLVLVFRKSGRLLLQIVNDILDFARIEARELCLQDAPFDPVSSLGISVRPAGWPPPRRDSNSSAACRYSMKPANPVQTRPGKPKCLARSVLATRAGSIRSGEI